MTEDRETTEQAEAGISGEPEEKSPAAVEAILAEVEDMRSKYLRLYAEFENYKKKVQRDREEFMKYANEAMAYELLPAIDNLEMALKHAGEGGPVSDALAQGVENTLREINRTLEKFGIVAIEALHKAFDPSYHHAMSQVERSDVESNTVVEEFRKGYLYKDKVLRASLVAVSKKE
ncbi:MAG: nucleotide exchange factor GrpE [Nitrospirae bacterium]|nr:nucleotide exchange factor GrpE [Nitrospirota bacterium]